MSSALAKSVIMSNFDLSLEEASQQAEPNDRLKLLPSVSLPFRRTQCFFGPLQRYRSTNAPESGQSVIDTQSEKGENPFLLQGGTHWTDRLSLEEQKQLSDQFRTIMHRGGNLPTFGENATSISQSEVQPAQQISVTEGSQRSWCGRGHSEMEKRMSQVLHVVNAPSFSNSSPAPVPMLCGDGSSEAEKRMTQRL